MIAALVTAVVVVIITLLCVGLVVFANVSLAGSAGTGYSTTSAPRPTTRTTQPTAPTTTTRPADPTSDAPDPTKEPSDPPTEATTAPTRKPSQGEAHHRTPQQGYRPVPLPDFPNSDQEAVRMVENSAIYGEKVSNSRCEKMPNLYNRPYGNLSAKQMRNRVQVMANCAQAMWAKPTKRAGFQATKVKMQVYQGNMSTPCGTVSEGTAAGFYCSANQQIYIHRGLGYTSSQGPQNFLWGHYLKVVTHEYGHHIQARTGVLLGEHYLASSSGSENVRLELSRRTELQANCYAGMAMRRSKQVNRSEARDWSSVTTDSDTHGSADHRLGWALQGYEERDIYQCNTFRAPSSDVS